MGRHENGCKEGIEEETLGKEGREIQEGPRKVEGEDGAQEGRPESDAQVGGEEKAGEKGDKEKDGAQESCEEGCAQVRAEESGEAESARSEAGDDQRAETGAGRTQRVRGAGAQRIDCANDDAVAIQWKFLGGWQFGWRELDELGLIHPLQND